MGADRYDYSGSGAEVEPAHDLVLFFGSLEAVGRSIKLSPVMFLSE